MNHFPALYFDTETADYSEDSSPALPVQIAAILATENRVVSTYSMILSLTHWEGIRRVRIAVEKPGIAAHGITEEMCDAHGIPAELALSQFRRMLSQAVVVIAHNIHFDVTVMNHAFATQCIPPVEWPVEFCTMRESAPILRIPSGGRYAIGGFKPPKLTEAYRHFVGREMVNNHDALADAYSCRAIHRGVLRNRAEAAEKATVKTTDRGAEAAS